MTSLKLGQNADHSESNSGVTTIWPVLLPLLGECLRSNPVMLEGSPKLLKRSDYPQGILRRIVDPHVEIFRVTRLAVLHDCEAADDQIVNLKFV